jgi:hypothetical protein
MEKREEKKNKKREVLQLPFTTTHNNTIKQ